MQIYAVFNFMTQLGSNMFDFFMTFYKNTIYLSIIFKKNILRCLECVDCELPTINTIPI